MALSFFRGLKSIPGLVVSTHDRLHVQIGDWVAAVAEALTREFCTRVTCLRLKHIPPKDMGRIEYSDCCANGVLHARLQHVEGLPKRSRDIR